MWIKEFIHTHNILQEEFDCLIKNVLNNVDFFRRKMNEEMKIKRIRE